MSNLSTNWGFVLREPGTDERIPVRVKTPDELPQWVALKADVADRRALVRQPRRADPAQRREAVPGHGDRERDAVPHPAQCRGRARRGRQRDAARGGDRGVCASGASSRWCASTSRRSAAPEVRRALLERFELDEEDVYETADGLLDYTDLFQIASLDIPELRDPPWTPLPPTRLPDEDADIFATIAGRRPARAPSLRKLRGERRALHRARRPTIRRRSRSR